MNSDLWIEEKHNNNKAVRFKVNKTLFSGKSEFQSVDIVETEALGRVLLNDGLFMVSEKDEFVYHDMIAHVPLFVHPNPKNVLIIGGGDGGTAREVLRHPSVQKCTMVEIDKMVVDACREFIPQTAKDLNHPNLTLLIEDGVKFLKETKEKFDIILIDSTDPIGPAAPLFGEGFYKDIHRCLEDDGIVVSQGEGPWWDFDMQNKLLEIVHNLFPIVRLYNFTNLTYPGCLWSFSFASKKFHPLKDFDENRVNDSELDFEYYNKDIHLGSFAQPEFIKKRISKYLKD